MKPYVEATYSTLFESWLGEGHEHDKIGRHLRWADIGDQLLVEYLVRKLKNSFVICEESPLVLYRGRVEQLDRADYRASARFEDDGVWIPADFFQRYFGTKAPTSPTVNLTQWVKESPDHTVTEIGRMRIVSPKGTVVLPHPEECKEEVARLQAFFDAPALPLPGGASEQTARVVTHVPFERNSDYRTHHYKTCYSPGLVLHRGAMYVAHEYSEVCNWRELSTETVLKRSVDGGESWEELGSVPDLRWATLTELGDSLCLLGSHLKTGEAILARWREDGGFETATIASSEVGGGAPTATVTHNGRFFRSYDHCVLSIEVGKDMMDPANWTLSERYTDLLDREWYLRESGETLCSNYRLLEGNMVLGRDGEIYNMLRIDCFPRHGYAALLRISADGKRCSVVKECNSLIRFPELAVSKFTVRYDSATERYLSLVSVHTLSENLHEQRNVLGLAVSEDLISWSIVDVLLSDREMMNAACSAFAHAYQYVDWVTDGENLLYLVREATGYTSSFHDGNYCTLYQLKDYARWIREKDGARRD